MQDPSLESPTSALSNEPSLAIVRGRYGPQNDKTTCVFREREVHRKIRKNILRFHNWNLKNHQIVTVDP